MNQNHHLCDMINLGKFLPRVGALHLPNSFRSLFALCTIMVRFLETNVSGAFTGVNSINNTKYFYGFQILSLIFYLLVVFLIFFLEGFLLTNVLVSS